MADREHRPWHEQVAATIIEALERGTAPWVHPWDPGLMPSPPVNALTGRPYRGVNQLWLSMQQYGYDKTDPRWCTYKQKRYEVTSLERPKVFHAVVFHASQIDGLPALPEQKAGENAAFERHQAAERLLTASNAKIFHDQMNSAFYRPSTDEIHLPEKGQFRSPDGYYATALHELGHWTGHESRLNRQLLGNPFGSAEYAREELRAEIASYMLGMELGIGHDPGQHHAYIESWIKILKDDPLEIIRAARDADQIRGYIVGMEKEKTTEQADDATFESVSVHHVEDFAKEVGPNGVLGIEDNKDIEGWPGWIIYFTAVNKQSFYEPRYDSALFVPDDSGTTMCSYAAQSGWETTDRYGNELSLEWLSPENDNTLTDREKIGVAARIARHIGYEHLAKDVEEEELEQEKNDLNGEHYSATSVKPWPNGFPVVYTHTSIAAMKGSYKGADAAKDAADYEAAKQRGDTEAARRLVARRVNPEHLERMVADLKERGISPEEVIVLPVLEKEQGKNVIPRVLGEYVAQYMNARLETKIVDVSRSAHTGKETINRLLDRKSFEGPVEENGKYLLVDDVLTQGGTLHELRHYLANNKAEAISAIALAFSRYSSTMEHRNTLSIQADTIRELERRYGRNELEKLLEDYNISGRLEALSEGEGRFLLGKKFKDINALEHAIKDSERRRIAEAGKTGARKAEAGSEPDVAGGTGGIQGVERGAGQTDASGQASSDDVSDTRAERTGKPEHYQSITSLFGADALYPEEADVPAVFPLASPVNPHDLAAVFPNAQINPLPDGYQVSVGKLSFGVHSVEQITPDTSLFTVSYGREMQAGERIAGAVRNGEILIAHIGDRNTLRHESWHLLEDLGLVTPKERDILNRAALKAVQAGKLPDISLQAKPAERRAWYVERQLARREFNRGTAEGQALQKMADLVDALANLARRTERGILRDLESGKLFEREPGAQRPSAEHYSAAKGNRIQVAGDATPEEARKIFDKLAPHLSSDRKVSMATTDGTMQCRGERMTAREKTWLNVPYVEKDRAWEAGARWDRKAKRWYAPAGTDLQPLQPWLSVPEKSRTQSPAVLDPCREFGEVLRAAGLVIEGDPVMDGQIHRVPVADGKRGARDGAYQGFSDGRPNGWYQNHKTGKRGKWLATGHVLTSEAKKALRQESAEKLADREELRKEDQARAMKRAYAKWMNAAPASPDHPYLARKGVAAYGLRQDKQGNLLVPGYNLETGRLQTVEYINETGAKWYEKDCPKKGAMAMLPDQDALKGEVVLMVEGYATGASVHQATGLPVAVAFDAGNIKDAALAIKRKMPGVKLTICADNDAPRITDEKNIGVAKAKEAASVVGGCKVIVADFDHDEKERGLTDFNDLHQARGLDAVRQCLAGPGIDLGHKAGKTAEPRRSPEKKGMER